MTSARVLLAAECAVRWHGMQPRKYTGEPYMVHPLSVARIVAEHGGTEDMVCAAVLHDVLEDTVAKPSELERVFGTRVLRLVQEVTEVSSEADGTRAQRKAKDLAHYAAGSPEAQTIKLADMKDNTRTVLMHDNPFSAIYMGEKRALLEALQRGEKALWYECKRQVDEYFAGARGKR